MTNMDRGQAASASSRRSSPIRVPWTLIGIASAASGVAIALVAFQGVRATTGVSAATALDEAIARGAMAAIPVAVSLYALRYRAHARFGRMLLGFSAVWFLALLSSSSSSFVYSVGRVAGWVSVLLLVFVILAFPSGRLVSRVDRALVGAVAAIVVLLYLSVTLLIQRYPAPSQFASCDTRCPRNAFMIASHQPAFVNGVLVPVRDLLVIVLMITVATRLAARIRHANTLVRQTLVPLFVGSIAFLLLIAAGILTRRVAPHSDATEAMTWPLAFAVPAIAAGFLVGMARWHMFVTAAVRRATARLQTLPGPEEVRDVLAEVFEDPKLQIAWWVRRRRHWVTAGGQTLEAPAPESGRWLTEVWDGDRRVVAIDHDDVLRDEPAFVDTAGSLARIAFEGQRLAGRTADALRQLKDSRARLLAAADGERRRIARDLHDGAQQRLVALRIDLELEAEKAERDNPDDAATLREFSAQVEEALEEFRSMTRGIYPAVLSDRGIADAVRAAALRSPVPATVEVENLTEYPQEIATAVYFCCLEALQNVAKHAAGATVVRIVLAERNAALRFSVSDNGPGFRGDRARLGAGTINMRDRLSVVGGELTIHSSPGGGTRIAGRIPLTPEAPAHPGTHGGEVRRPVRPHLRRDHAQ